MSDAVPPGPPGASRPEPDGPAGAPADAGSASPSFRDLVIKSFGGWWGLFDSALPVVAFVIANVIGGLGPALWTGLGVGVLILLVRLVRRESVQQAISGFLGIAVCVLIARLTGEARGFFLLGIWRSALIVAAGVVSAVVRWPLVGLLWELFDPSPGTAGRTGRAPWRADKALMRVYTWTTLLWSAAYAGRFLLEQFLYDENSTGLLGVVRIAVGYPMLVILVGVTYLAVRRVRRRTAAAAGTPAPDATEDPDAAAGPGRDGRDAPVG